MLKTKKQKIKIGATVALVLALLLVAGTMTGVILTSEDYTAVGADDTSAAHSSLSKKYNSGKSDDNISDKDGDSEDGDNSDGADKDGENKHGGNSSNGNGDNSSGGENDSSVSDNGSDNHGGTSGGNNGNEGGNSGVVTTYQDVASEESIPFSVETRSEVNLPRGEIRIASAGANGTRRIVTRQTYQNGSLVAAEVVSNDVLAEPVNQVNLLGTSDYNMNNSYIQLYPNASVSRDGGVAPAFMILVNGNYYMDFWYDPLTWHRYAPATALNVSGGSFYYDGMNYGYVLGPLDSNYALSEAFCAEYRLACGRW